MDEAPARVGGVALSPRSVAGLALAVVLLLAASGAAVLLTRPRPVRLGRLLVIGPRCTRGQYGVCLTGSDYYDERDPISLKWIDERGGYHPGFGYSVLCRYGGVALISTD